MISPPSSCLGPTVAGTCIDVSPIVLAAIPLFLLGAVRLTQPELRLRRQFALAVVGGAVAPVLFVDWTIHYRVIDAVIVVSVVGLVGTVLVGVALFVRDVVVVATDRFRGAVP